MVRPFWASPAYSEPVPYTGIVQNGREFQFVHTSRSTEVTCRNKLRQVFPQQGTVAEGYNGLALNTFMSFDAPSRDMCGWSMHTEV